MHTREPFAEGHHFAGTGAYEVLTATAHYAVVPEAPAHRPIPDLDIAPRDSSGRVRFSGDVVILRPVDGGRRRLFFDWGHRGNKRAVQYFCAARTPTGPGRSPTQAPATCFATDSRSSSVPGGAICCRATGGCCSTCLWRRGATNPYRG
ncbi:hypothetical protein JK364_48165 [Streptomyces sp. 110]|uniref:Uncharacterized protein n=1 Tax=Streptomyces endocoffeicus TaxID=2898945 RepID=A0ABS1Q6P0_9ACTN|nr:hypothetical protein [Streptomyces endocoffeicus]MBL1120024.1 hypothetical protein [Streptomyces endocoffeicus]